jgi:hypothetical protein
MLLLQQSSRMKTTTSKGMGTNTKRFFSLKSLQKKFLLQVDNNPVLNPQITLSSTPAKIFKIL